MCKGDDLDPGICFPCGTGDDLDKVGGAEADNNFMSLSDSSSCGKMTALAKLLDLWYSQQNANKVSKYCSQSTVNPDQDMLSLCEYVISMRKEGQQDICCCYCTS